MKDSPKFDIRVEAAYLKLRHPERQHHGAVDVVAGRGAHGGAGGMLPFSPGGDLPRRLVLLSHVF